MSLECKFSVLCLNCKWVKRLLKDRKQPSVRMKLAKQTERGFYGDLFAVLLPEIRNTVKIEISVQC